MKTEPAFQYAERLLGHGYHSHFKNMKERYSPPAFQTSGLYG